MAVKNLMYTHRTTTCNAICHFEMTSIISEMIKELRHSCDLFAFLVRSIYSGYFIQRIYEATWIIQENYTENPHCTLAHDAYRLSPFTSPRRELSLNI